MFDKFIVVSGPCVIESEQQILEAADFLKNLFEKTPFTFYFKASYDKANRSSIDAYRGPGIDEGLRILQRVKQELDVALFTDVHSPEEARAAAEVCDVIQIPAFLCRQTDLLVAAGETGAIVNVKKGQFMAPWDMGNVVAKLRSTGTTKILLTERGTTFGYNNLVSDMRAIPLMQRYDCPVLYDVTHSVQLPGGQGTQSGGQREFIPTLARAAIAAGCNGIFAEAHRDPAQAKSDGASMIPFAILPALVSEWEKMVECLDSLSPSLLPH